MITFNVKTSLFNGGRIYYGLLILPVFASLVFSFNYHAIWLVYDIIAVALFYELITSREKSIFSYQRYFLVFVIGYFVFIVIMSNHWFIGFLSIWDTFKHLIYFATIANICRRDAYYRNTNLAKTTYRLIGFAYILQIITVGIQYNSGAHYDDVAGSFGDGGSHAIGYISLLYIIASIAFHKKHMFMFGLISVAIMLNIASENVGFYILLIMMMFSVLMARGINVKRRINVKYILTVGAIIFVTYMLLNMSYYSKESFGETIIGRAISLFEIPTYSDQIKLNGRGPYLSFAYSLGGWFGHGPGAYSNIYSMDGYDFAGLVGQQINISEATHLIAESGMVGLYLTITLYLMFVVKLFDTIIIKFLMGFIFISSIFYSAILMNESHVFLLLLSFYFFRTIEIDGLNKYRSDPEIRTCR